MKNYNYHYLLYNFQSYLVLTGEKNTVQCQLYVAACLVTNCKFCFCCNLYFNRGGLIKNKKYDIVNKVKLLHLYSQPSHYVTPL